MTLAVRGGLQLLLAYFALIAVALVALRARAAEGPPERAAVAGALAVATVLLIPPQLVEPYFVTTGMPHLWWALLGLVLAGAEGVRRASRDG